MNEDEPKITIRVSQFLKYCLGELEQAPIEMEEARLLEILQPPSIYLQFYDLDKPEVPLKRPVVWQQKYWHLDLYRRKVFREKNALERLARNKQADNINIVTKAFMRKMSLPENLARFAAEKAVLSREGNDTMKAFGAQIEELTPEEWNALKEYNEMLRQRLPKKS